MAFYGTGGTENEMKAALTSPKYRPSGHDCNTQGTFHFHHNSNVSTLHISLRNLLYFLNKIFGICFQLKQRPHRKLRPSLQPQRKLVNLVFEVISLD